MTEHDGRFAMPDPAASGKQIDQHHNLRSRIGMSGYPAELRIGRTLANAGWDIEHAAFYRDPFEKAWREIDILARLSPAHSALADASLTGLSDTRLGQRSHGTTSVREIFQPTYVIECKKSKHEWVVFLPSAGVRDDTDSYPMPCFAPEGVGRDLVDLVDIVAQRGGVVGTPVDEADDLLHELPLTPPDLRGHGLAAVADAPHLEQGKNKAFKAVESCVRAVQFFERRQRKQFERKAVGTTPGSSPLTVSVYLPLVVLEGQLFTMNVDGEGRDILREVSSAAVHISAGGTTSGITVPIVTTAALQQFASQARDLWSKIAAYATTDGGVPNEKGSVVALLGCMLRGDNSWGSVDDADGNDLGSAT